MAYNRLNLLFALCCAVTLSISVERASAQSSQDVDRAQLMVDQNQSPFAPSPNSTGLDDGHAASSPNDADLGVQEILKRAETYQPFSASVACPIYYTSNVALVRSGVQSDLITAPVAGVFYQPRITQTLYAFANVRQQFFYYNHYNSFDFGSLNVEGGLTYFLPQLHNLLLRGEYNFNQLTYSDRVLDEFFSNHSLIFDAEIPFRFSRAHQLAIGADTNLSIAADHQSPRRNDYEAYAGYSCFFTRDLSLNAVGRVVIRDYHQNDRTDVSEILSVTANYRLTDWWSVSAISTFATSDSNQSVYDYSVVNIGGALSLAIKF